MSTWSGRLMGSVAWVAVVVVGAVLVWAVISRAGAGLVSDAGTITPSSAPAASDGAATGSSTPVRSGRWQGEPGVVTATCLAGDIALVGAQPEDGVVVHVLDPGPDQLVVAFSGDDEGDVVVSARCRGGRPDFTVSSGAPGGTPPASPSDPGDHTTGEPDGGSGDESGDDSGSESGDG